MGDRITTYLPCPKCRKETEQYDASSSLIWSWNCNHCGWKDDCQYYETGKNEISLLSKNEAGEKGFCTNCGMNYGALWNSRAFDVDKYFEYLETK